MQEQMNRLGIECRELRGKACYVFENHATAIVPWAELTSDYSDPIDLITLDHHTDTNPSYLRSFFRQVGRDMDKMEAMRCEKIAGLDRNCMASMEASLEGLYHDEHIDLAIRLGMFKTAYVIQHSHHELLPEWEEHSMVVWPTEIDLRTVSQDEARTYMNLALEDDFLQAQLQQLPSDFSLEKSPYILDIDLDYFKSRRSLLPEHRDVIKALVDHSIGVSIAMESEWVERLCWDDDLSATEMLKMLYSVVED
jgi:hypothetical protein